mmetsp:Transcript_41420/g.84675  ORF Transcript_41420/g.84675 Transcript_41420/m.84675 type:complete len:102 (-) Transcript_41420:27-332(-)
MHCKGQSSMENRESSWTALDLTSFFGNVFVLLEPQVNDGCKQASLVLLNLRHRPARLTFIHPTSPRVRLSEADAEAYAAIAALSSAMIRAFELAAMTRAFC